MKNTATEETASAGQKSGFTPGPWYYDRYCSVAPFGKYAIGAKGIRSIAVTTGSALSELTAENEANARLIASAPDLLAALEKAARELGCYVASGGPKSTVDAYQSARAAIARAKGVQS